MIEFGTTTITVNPNAVAALADSGELVDGLEIIGQVGELSAKEHAPVDTGNLRRSITHEVIRGQDGWFVQIGTNVDYAIFQELGTRFHPAHPFLRPAIEAVRRLLAS